MDTLGHTSPLAVTAPSAYDSLCGATGMRCFVCESGHEHRRAPKVEVEVRRSTPNKLVATFGRTLTALSISFGVGDMEEGVLEDRAVRSKVLC